LQTFALKDTLWRFWSGSRATRSFPGAAMLEVSMTLKLSSRTMDGVTIVDCSGRIIFGDETVALRDFVKEHLKINNQIVINLAAVNYIDSGGLGTLVGLYTSARGCGGQVKLASLTTRVGELLQVTKLLTVFEVFDNDVQAVRSFAQRATA
jgi:anti-sigma B factor antagonist